VILPITTADKNLDAPDLMYQPVSEVDKENFDMYDPELFHGMPVALQLVGRNLAEESLLAIAEVVDLVVKTSGSVNAE
jgi:amidase